MHTKYVVATRAARGALLAPEPPLVFVEELAQLIGKTDTTIRTYSADPRRRDRIPPPIRLPNSRRLCWLREEVYKWIYQRIDGGKKFEKTRGRPKKQRPNPPTGEG